MKIIDILTHSGRKLTVKDNMGSDEYTICVEFRKNYYIVMVDTKSEPRYGFDHQTDPRVDVNVVVSINEVTDSNGDKIELTGSELITLTKSFEGLEIFENEIR